MLMHSFTINSCSPHRRLPHWWLLLGLMTFLGPWSDFSKAPSRTPTDFLKHWKHHDCWRSKHLAAHCYSPTWFASFTFLVLRGDCSTFHVHLYQQQRYANDWIMSSEDVRQLLSAVSRRHDGTHAAVHVQEIYWSLYVQNLNDFFLNE